MASRCARLFKILEGYRKAKPNQFDSSVVFSKVKLMSLSEEGISRSRFKIDTSMCNGGDTLHGGFVAACTDALSVFTHMGNTGKVAWTMSLHVDYVTSARVGEEITVDTSVLRGGSYPILEVKFCNVDGTLVARGTTSLVNGKDKYQELLKDTYNIDS